MRAEAGGGVLARFARSWLRQDCPAWRAFRGGV